MAILQHRWLRSYFDMEPNSGDQTHVVGPNSGYEIRTPDIKTSERNLLSRRIARILFMARWTPCKFQMRILIAKK
jgi:hypothetical protein